jgi:hypothetical protein
VTDPTTDRRAGEPALAEPALRDREEMLEPGNGAIGFAHFYKPLGAGLCCGRLKVGCAKDTNWLLFDPNEIQRFAHEKKGIIKKGEEKS